MPVSELLMEGLDLMLMGLGVVFLFLGVLVLCVMGVSRVIGAMFGPARELGAEPAAVEVQPTHGELIAVISAAVHRFRSGRRRNP